MELTDREFAVLMIALQSWRDHGLPADMDAAERETAELLIALLDDGEIE